MNTRESSVNTRESSVNTRESSGNTVHLYLYKEANEVAVVGDDDPERDCNEVFREELQMGVGTIPEEWKERHQFTSNVHKNGVHTCKIIKSESVCVCVR